MIAGRYYIGKVQWDAIVRAWFDKFVVLAPQQKKGHHFWDIVTLDNIGTIVYDETRPVQPIKSYLIPPLEEVVGKPATWDKPWLFLGIKACDLNALTILDRAFGGDFADPNYQLKRQQGYFISSDCTQPLKTCCCTWVGGEPYATTGFDLNLSKIWDGFIIEVGSEKGQRLLDGHEDVMKTVVKEEAKSLERMRKQTTINVKKQNRNYKLEAPQRVIISSSYDSSVWSDHVATCVECGACNHACPTCHCYFLDDITRESFVRLRGWDACQYSGYAVTAGGGTPRPKIVERFRNRYLCKFKYLDDNYNQLGCTGCGRCIEGCQGKIDMRACIHDLEKR